jgi:nucleoside-diphosphate-sugar epimerase
MSTVLVIGGAGFLGGAASRALRDAHHEVVSASRGNRDGGDGISHVTLDRQDERALARVICELDPEVVVDMACYQPFEIDAMLRLVGDRRYIFCSTVSVYDRPDFPNHRPVSEDDFIPRVGVWPNRLDNPFSGPGTYALGKQWCETLLYHVGDAVDWVSLRFPAVFGRRDYTQRLTSYMQRIEDGGPVLIPAEAADTPFVVGWNDDMARAVVAAVDPPVSRISAAAYNVGYGDVSCRDFLTDLARAMGHSPHLVEVPIANIPPAARRYGPHAAFPGLRTERAETDLAWSFSPLSLALADSVAWFRDAHPCDPD